MNLDKMKKEELLKTARTLMQEIKALKKKTDSVNVDELPLQAASFVNDKGQFKVVKLRYDLESGKAAVESVETHPSHHMGLYNMEQFIISNVEKQIIKEDK